jgi:hypothetical protein
LNIILQRGEGANSFNDMMDMDILNDAELLNNLELRWCIE